MAAVAQLGFASAPTWSNGRLFSGYLLILATPPSGRGELWYRKGLRVPDRYTFRIEEGEFDVGTAHIFRTDYLEPPNVKYLDFWYDLTGYFLTSGSAQFEVTADEYNLTPPTLTAPSAGDAPEAPTSAPVTLADQSYVTVGTWTPDGTTTDFALPSSGGIAIIFLNGVIQVEGVHYTRDGSTITFTSAPQPDDQVGYYLFT